MNSRRSRLHTSSRGLAVFRSLAVCGRDGFTLYEVLLALALLLGSMAVLSQHISVGARASIQGSLQTRATLLAETKMAELLSGIEPLQSTGNMPFADAGPGWSWSLVSAAGATPELLDLTLTVTHVDSQDRIDANFVLRRLTRDPALFTAPVDATTGTTGTGTTGTGTTGTGSTP